MSGTKRVGVPPVAKPRIETPLIPEKTTPAPKPVSDILEGEARTKNTVLNETRQPTERNTSVNPIKTLIAAVKNNKTPIARKLLVVAGASVGMLITSTLVDRLNPSTPDVEVIVLNADDLTVTEDTETTPAQ